MHLVTYTIILTSTLVLASGQLTEFLKWSYIDYLWESNYAKYNALKSGKYDFSSVLPMDVDVDHNGRIFITLLGKVGVPATLGIVTNVTGTSGPLIQPYPGWSWFNDNDNCDTIHNVYRIAIDECNRLFVLDTGFIEGMPLKCEPQLLIFDLNNDQHIQTIKIPSKILKNRSGLSLLANPIVDAEGSNCEKTTVYIADPYSYALVVISSSGIVRLENKSFLPNEEATQITSGKRTGEVGGGILGMALSPRIFSDEPRHLYFRPIASYDMFAVTTDSIKNTAYGPTNLIVEKKENIFSSQVVTMAFSSEGTLFYGLTRENAIGCWNKFVPMEPQWLGIVAQDDERLQYLNGVKVIKPTATHPEEELWVLSNRFVSYMANALNPRDINFRVIKGPVKSLIAGTNCDMPLNVKQWIQSYKNETL